MKISKPKNLRPVLIVASVIGLVLVASLAYLYRPSSQTSVSLPPTNNPVGEAKVNLDKPTQDQIDAGSDAKKQALEKGLEANNGSSADKITTLTVTSSNVSSSRLSLRIFIQDIVSGGTCILTMTNSQTATRIDEIAEVQPLPNGAACKGFDVDISRLSDSSEWSTEITYKGDIFSGRVTKEVSI